MVSRPKPGSQAAVGPDVGGESRRESSDGLETGPEERPPAPSRYVCGTGFLYASSVDDLARLEDLPDELRRGRRSGSR